MADGTLDDVTQYVGGASGPTKGGSRVHATWPLVTLSIGPGRLVLSGRGPLRRIFRETIAHPADVAVEAVHRPLMKGLVIVTKDERWLFWTGNQRELLGKLSEQGAQVAPGERRVKWSDTMGY